MALSLIPVCGTTLLNTFVLHVWMVKWMGACIHLYAVFPNDYAFSFVCARFVVTTWQFSFTYIPQDYFTHARARAASLKDMGNGPYDYLNLMIWQKQKKITIQPCAYCMGKSVYTWHMPMFGRNTGKSQYYSGMYLRTTISIQMTPVPYLCILYASNK